MQTIKKDSVDHPNVSMRFEHIGGEDMARVAILPNTATTEGKTKVVLEGVAKLLCRSDELRLVADTLNMWADTIDEGTRKKQVRAKASTKGLENKKARDGIRDAEKEKDK